MTIYDRVKLLCKEHKVKIGQMEKDLGISRGSAYRWNTSKPTSATLMKLAEYFNVDPLFITDGMEGDDKTFDIKDDLNKMIMMLKNKSVNIEYYGKEVDEKTRQLLVLRIENMKDALDVLLY